MTTTPTSGEADLPEALHRVIDDFERRERGIPQAHIAAALVTELRAALTAQAISKAPDHIPEVGNMVAQAISAEQAGVPAATVIKRGADREWMSERLGHLPDGVYSLYLAARYANPQFETYSQRLEGKP